MWSVPRGPCDPRERALLNQSERRPQRAPLLTALGLLVPLVASCGGGDAPSPVEPASPEEGGEWTPPRIEVVDLPGLEAALERRKGQGFLLNFWAIWCGPCVEELPELIEVAHAARAEGGDVVGVSYDLMVAGADLEGMPATMARFLEKKRLDFEVLLYDDDDYEGINARFQLPGEVPVTLAIDASGAVVDRQEGKAGRARFEEMMQRALGRE